MEESEIEEKIDEGITICKKRPLSHLVYRGFQSLIGGKVKKEIAVKFFSGNGQDDDAYEQYLEKLVNVEPHSNVVQIIKCDRVTNNELGRFFIAMSLCHEKTLADIDLESLSMEERMNICLQVCHGLKHLHSHGICHSKLTPSNILFSRDGKKVMLSPFRFGGKVDTSQTWDNAKMQDISSLGCVVCCIFGYRLHLLASKESIVLNYRNPSHPPPNEGYYCLAHLIGRMRSSDSQKQLDINKVLGHFIFWNSTRKVHFYLAMYYSFFHQKSHAKLSVNGTKQQKAAYINLTYTGSGSGESSDTESEDGIEFQRSDEDLAKQIEEEELSKILNEMRRVISGQWVEKVTGAEGYIKPKEHLPDRVSYGNSFAEMIRYKRNYHIYRIRVSGGNPEETWEFFSPLFPELLPYFYDMMEPTFNDALRKEYKLEEAHPGKLDLSRILSKTSEPN